MFDTDRASPHVITLQGKTSELSHLGNIELRADDTGETLIMPLRMVLSDKHGVALELGPFSLNPVQAQQLRDALIEFLARTRWAESNDSPDTRTDQQEN